MKLSKSIVVVLVNLVVCLLLVEGISAIALRSLTGRWISKSGFVGQQLAAEGERGADAPDEAALAADLDAPRWILHPFVGFARNPEALVHKLNDRPVDLPVNTHGFFGPSPLIRARDDRFVVLVTGGSMAAEMFLDARHVLAERLAALPDAMGKEMVIVSTALGGVKQPQQLMGLSYFLSLGAHYDVVVNLDGFNEVVLPLVENHQLGVYPFFPRNWIAYSSTSVDLGQASLYGRTAGLRARLRERVRRLAGSWSARSYAGLALWQLRQRSLEAELLDLDQQLREAIASEELSPQQRGPKYPKKGPKKMREDLVANWSRSSAQMLTLSRSAGIDYFHFLQPNQYLEGSKPLSDWESQYAFNPHTPYAPKARDGYPLLIDAGGELRRGGVPFFDLTMVYRDVTESLYKDTCCHVNREGYEILAGAIADAVVDAPN